MCGLGRAGVWLLAGLAACDYRVVVGSTAEAGPAPDGGGGGGDDRDCSARSSCDACLAREECGWCESDETCSVEGARVCEWGWDPNVCLGESCYAELDTCDACQTRRGCGWCGDLEMCIEGDSRGSEDGICDDAWVFGSCDVDPCSFHSDCFDCVTTDGCGWCGPEDRCRAGDPNGPADGECWSGWGYGWDPGCFEYCVCDDE